MKNHCYSRVTQLLIPQTWRARAYTAPRNVSLHIDTAHLSYLLEFRSYEPPDLRTMYLFMLAQVSNFPRLRRPSMWMKLVGNEDFQIEFHAAVYFYVNYPMWICLGYQIIWAWYMCCSPINTPPWLPPTYRLAQEDGTAHSGPAASRRRIPWAASTPSVGTWWEASSGNT